LPRGTLGNPRGDGSNRGDAAARQA
jgi:hypothetical protein